MIVKFMAHAINIMQRKGKAILTKYVRCYSQRRLMQCFGFVVISNEKRIQKIIEFHGLKVAKN